KYPDDQDYFIDKTIMRGDGPDQAISSKIWRFRSGNDRMDLGLIKLPALDQTLSGVVVDRMGNPLKGYKITIEGKGQPANKTCVSDQSGRFQLDGLCSGLVDVSATNGTYRIFSKWVQVGGTLRLVSADHPVQQAAQADESLGTVDISVIDADTKKPVQGEKLRIVITPEQGKDFYLKPDENGEFKTQLPEGCYTIDAINYPFYEGCKIKIEVKSRQSMNVELLMNPNPCIEGVIHFPESVRSDEIEVKVEPRISGHIRDFAIAGDGQFTCRLEFTQTLGSQELSHVWFWVCTKDKQYIAVVKHPVKEQHVEITLEPEAIIKIKGKANFYLCRWEQQEIAKLIGMTTTFNGELDVDGYYVLRGLAARKEGLKYIIFGAKGEIVVDSKELEPGKTKIIEIP
ncbi:MAG: carboxypeptidase-like regulatory domain-containing protein, partial [Anaerohalosphaeraceae bacterium]